MKYGHVQYSKTCLKRLLKKMAKNGFKTNYCLIAILLTFIRLPVVIKIFVLSVFEWRLRQVLL